jgi:Flp pilus assembly protein TadD
MSTTVTFKSIALFALLAAPLGACTTTMPGGPFRAAAVTPPAEQAETSAYVQPVAPPDLTPIDNKDDLALGKQYFEAADWGLAEQHFRRAAEKATGPRARDAEAWLGLAASYDQLKRFELADRAYSQAKRAVGPTPELLNNQGYSYFLRRDFKRARSTYARARQKDPGNPYIRNNIALLDATAGAVVTAKR